MKSLLTVAASLMLLGCLATSGAGTMQAQDSSASQPDNTRMNKADNNSSNPTADQQQKDRSDRDITQQIRKSITMDKSLSTYAHNVKIIAQSGMVTLRGPVRTDEEKQTIEQKAAEVVGKDKVTSELSVKPDKQ